MRDERNRRVYTDEETGRFLSATYEQYCVGTGIVIPAQEYEDMEDAVIEAGYDMTAYVLRDGEWVIEPLPDTRSASDKRQEAYTTLPIIALDGDEELKTVDFVNDLWFKYSAEGNETYATVLQGKIADAKAQIREMFPEEN